MRYRLTNQKARLPFKLHAVYMKDLDRYEPFALLLFEEK